MRPLLALLLAPLLLAGATAFAALPERHVNGKSEQPAPAAGKGAVVVHSNPSGHLIIDGRDTGLRTPGARLDLDPGAHTMQVIYDDSKVPSGEKTVLIAPGETTTHNFVRKEPASKFEKDCKAGSKDDCWKYGTALIQEKRFDEAIKVFEDWERANPKDKRAPIAAFLVKQTKKHMADEAAKSAAGGGTGTIQKTAAQGLAPGSGEQAAAPADNAPTGAPGSEAATAREAGTANTPVNAAAEASGANADPAALEGSGSTTEPEHHLGFAAVAGIAAAIVAALGLFFWRRRRS
ncbi:MAG: hypothetical protein HQ461_10500 [Deltaproteobacteria bacterium]|nr:hypothetical protein [Deltaproteobacteria bacterium]